MSYLLPSEYEGYGLSAETPDALVNTASALMEAHCRRPSLMSQQYTERCRFTTGSHTVRLSYGPLYVGAVVSARVRYTQGRRGEYVDLSSHQELGLEIAKAFGLPGTWSTLDASTIDVYESARELSFPANFLGLGYNEAEVVYTAGFVTVPYQIKAACAQIVRNAQTTPGLNVKTSRMDTLQLQYFSDSLIDDGVRLMLKPWIAEKLG